MKFRALGVSIVLIFALAGAVAHAQELTAEERAVLQAQYDKLQVEIAEWQKVLDETKAKKNTLKGDVTALTAQINKAQAEINQRNVVITQLQSQITQKAKAVATLEVKLSEGQEAVAKLLRQKNESDATPLAVLALSSGSLSDFFGTIEDIDTLDQALQEHFDELRAVKTQTEAEKDALAKKRSAQVDARYQVELSKQQIAANKAQKNQLLAITTNQETEYQKVLAANQAKAAAIRAALFPLRDAAAIQFGEALRYAQDAQKTTGVDPALVLSILTQESNLGTNVGQCYLVVDSTGAGISKKNGTVFAKVMNPARDVPPFLALAQKLGFDPHHQVVSCPIASAGGWGGAMGPAQFIPSTWTGLAGRIASARGVSTANPWDPQDAIAAMSIYLGDLGAAAGGYTAEFNAAARYYAGWNGPNTRAGRTYANQVMARVADMQKNIDFLNNL